MSFVARGARARDLCAAAVVDLAVGRLPACVDLLEGSPDRWARLDTDMVLISRRYAEPPSAPHRRAGNAILHARIPVLFLPPARRARMVGSRALIAWDGSESAAAALVAATPLLRRAREVMLVDALPDGERIDVARAADFVRSLPGERRLDVTGQWLESPAALMQMVQLCRADYLVMGGFGFWRALPDILYGDCDSAFLRTPVPLLLGH
ncbi:MAG: hypothetical protein JF595_06505 [Sphingomonadales bacterium]|nr:hypothetical protein [Sphingomonadales bacterium]